MTLILEMASMAFAWMRWPHKVLARKARSRSFLPWPNGPRGRHEEAISQVVKYLSSLFHEVCHLILLSHLLSSFIVPSDTTTYLALFFY